MACSRRAIRSSDRGDYPEPSTSTEPAVLLIHSRISEARPERRRQPAALICITRSLDTWVLRNTRLHERLHSAYMCATTHDYNT